MYRDALSMATEAVITAETTIKQASVNYALTLVTELPSGTPKTSLLSRLDDVQNIFINTPVVIDTPPRPELPLTRNQVRVSASVVNGVVQLTFSNEGVSGISYMMSAPQIQLLADGDDEYVFKYAEGERDAAWFENNGTEFTDYFIVTSNNSYTVFAENPYGNTASASFEITNILEEGNSVVALNQSPTIMTVTVPMALPVSMDAAGNITVANNTSIINSSFGPIRVSSVTVTGANDWAIISWDSDYSKEKVDAKHFSITINNNAVDTDGTVNDGIGTIDGLASKGFTYDAKIAPRVTSLEDQQIAKVVFVIDWSYSTI